MSAPPNRANLVRVVERRRIVVCCGTGGVGKTTTAAVIALEGARRGRNAVVVTIDPAKRLANTLGLDVLTNTARAIDRSLWDPNGLAPKSGRFSALMLDTKTTFDHLVTRYAEGEQQAHRILENRFYRNISGALGGTQEYMAMEKLHELHEEGGYDLIVVDTPPTRHALDFLDAPNRIVRLLDNRIFRLLMMPTRAYLKITTVAVQTFLRTVSKVVGTAVIEDVVAFFRAFEGMEAGFRDRAARVEQLLSDAGTSFVLVTAPRRDAVGEAAFFAHRLAQSDLPIDALIVNRIHPQFGDELAGGLAGRAASLREMDGDPERHAAAERLGALYANLADFQEIAARERSHLEGLQERIGTAGVAYVPFLSSDVHDFESLGEIAELLFHSPASVRT